MSINKVIPIFVMDRETTKELGKYFVDISKYIVTSVLISTLFSTTGNILFISMVGFLTAIIFLVWGLACMSNNRKRGKK